MPEQVFVGIAYDTDQLLFSPGPRVSLAAEISALCPQLETPETTSV
jgi:hypothetical protein